MVRAGRTPALYHLTLHRGGGHSRDSVPTQANCPFYDVHGLTLPRLSKNPFLIKVYRHLPIRRLSTQMFGMRQLQKFRSCLTGMHLKQNTLVVGGTMSTGVSFAGLSSGIDSGQIIEQLLAIDRRPAVLLENQNAIEEFKLEVLQQINTDLLSVKTSADALSDGSAFDVFSTSSSNTDLVTATASGATSPGSFSVEVISLAQAQSRSSKSFSSPSEDLGLTGEIVISGHTISIDSSDSLVDIQGAINAADVGVSAQILQVSETDNRMILTSTSTGSEGFSLLDASTTDVLQSLGFTGSGTSIKNSVTGCGKTDQFNSGTTAVGTLVGLTGGLSGNITIGDKVVAVDLATMSLTDIKAAIDLAAPTGVTTSIVAEEDEYGSNLFRLQHRSGVGWPFGRDLRRNRRHSRSSDGKCGQHNERFGPHRR